MSIATTPRSCFGLFRAGLHLKFIASLLILAGGTLAQAQLGVPISAPLPVNTNAGSDATNQDAIPQLATDGQGCWIAVWQLSGAPSWGNGTDPDVYFSRSVDHGQTWTAPALIDANGAIDSFDDLVPRIFTDGSGHWICAWVSTTPLNGSTGDRDIVFSRSLDNGQNWSLIAALNSNHVVDFFADMDIELICAGSGVWIAAWRSLDTFNGSLGGEGDIIFARSTDHGVSWSQPAPLNTNATTDAGLDQKPRLAVDAQGRVIAVWHSTESFAGAPADNDILFSLSMDIGVSWSPSARLNTNAAGDTRPDTDARIITNGLGQWLVAWASTNNVATNGTEGDILFSRSSDLGQTWSPPLPLNTNALGDSGLDATPALSRDVDGNWLAAWTSNDTLNNTIGSDNDILISRSINAGASWSPPIPMNTNAAGDPVSGTDEFAQVVCDMHGGFMGVWESRGTSGTDRDVLWSRFALPDCNINTLPDPQEPDCNRNNTPDSCDISAGTSVDLNGNQIPDECEKPGEPCPADATGNGVVNIDDLVTVIVNWGSTTQNNPGDVTGNNIVNIDDLVMVVTNWGPCD